MADEKAGINFLLQVSIAGVYTLLGGLQSKTFKLNTTDIDVTNHGSAEWKTLLDGHGLRSCAVSGKGVCDGSQALRTVEDACLSQTLTSFKLIDTSSGGRTYTALFKVHDFEQQGTHNGPMDYSISLMSSGPVTVS